MTISFVSIRDRCVFVPEFGEFQVGLLAIKCGSTLLVSAKLEIEWFNEINKSLRNEQKLERNNYILIT